LTDFAIASFSPLLNDWLVMDTTIGGACEHAGAASAGVAVTIKPVMRRKA
jgi:hypothetical protein